MDVEAWLHNIPLITKIYMIGAFGVSVAVTFELVSPLSLYLNHTLVWQRREYWRLVTTFLFFDKLGINFFFNMHFLYFYARRLEEHFYFNRTGEFLFMLVCAAVILVLLSVHIGVLFLGQPLVMVILYVWSRRFPDELLNLYGVFTVTSAYLPFAMTGLAYLLGGQEAARLDVYALVIGHVLWYFADVFPQITGWHVMSPSCFVALFARQRVRVE